MYHLLDLFKRNIKLFCRKKTNKQNFLPGSVWPRATTESKFAGGFLNDELSAVIVCSLPKATSFFKKEILSFIYLNYTLNSY